jgi:hypothetical protein
VTTTCKCGHALGSHPPAPEHPFAWPCRACDCPAYEERRDFRHCAPHEILVAFGREVTCLHPQPKCDWAEYKDGKFVGYTCDQESMVQSYECPVHTLEQALYYLDDNDNLNGTGIGACMGTLMENGWLAVETDLQTNTPSASLKFAGLTSIHTGRPNDSIVDALRGVITFHLQRITEKD